MLQIELAPDLTHCIETVARGRHREIVSRLLSSEVGNEALMESGELLRSFLETADFRKLRSESEPHLVAGQKVTFVVYPEGGSAGYRMQID